jgi:hypothetical protein
MKDREFWTDFIKTYFMVATLITGVMGLIGSILMPEVTFGYQAFWSPLFYAAVGTLPNLVLYSKRELTVKELLFRKLLQLLLIEAGIFFVAFFGVSDEWRQPHLMLALGGSVFVVYLLATLIAWIENLLSARAISEELLRFQQKYSE